MKRSKKAQHCLFLEEEVYNWASEKTSVNRRLVYLALLFMFLALLFNILS